MKLLLILTVICGAWNISYSQETEKESNPNTWAAIIGISDYQDREIEDLVSPVKDAKAFTVYLRSKAGGNVPGEQIRLLIDKEATQGSINSTIHWLTESGKEGDRVIIYFAGYGDYTTGQKKRPVLLLPHDAKSSSIMPYLFSFTGFKNFMSTWAKENNLQLIMIMDSYVLPKDKDESFEMLKDASDIKKIGVEYMITSKKNKSWTSQSGKSIDVRETFSHSLLNGLTGIADKDGDHIIYAHEVVDYIQSQMITQKNISSSLYLHTSHDLIPVAEVDERSKNMAISHEDIDLPIVKLQSLSSYKNIIEKADASAQNLYQDFLIALNLGNLLGSQEGSANYYYEKLMMEPSMHRMKNNFKRLFATTLQEEAQQAINSYLKLDSKVLSVREQSGSEYEKYANYLRKAAELLGSNHYQKDRLAAIQNYFIGISKRLNIKNGESSSETFMAALKIQEEALKYEDEAPFIYNEIGLLHSRLGHNDQALFNYKQAIKFAPSWGAPYSNIGAVYIGLNDLESALFWFKKSIEVYPEYATPYYNIACLYSLEGKPGKSINWLEKALVRGFLREELINSDPDLENIRKKGKYRALMKRYFPKTVDKYD